MNNAKSTTRLLAGAILLAFAVHPAWAQKKTTPKTPRKAPPKAAPALPELSPRELAEGVWASSLPRGANVGWFTLSDYVVAIDSGVSDAEGRMILESIKKTTKGKPVRYLIITHAHGDHAGGARTFAAAGAIVLCEQKAAPAIAGLLYHPPANPQDPLASGTIHPTLEQIDRLLLMSDGVRAVELDYLGPAHTAGDIIVYLPKDGILFCGDIAVNGTIPFLQSSDVNPENWLTALNRLSHAKIEKLVPGHGAIGPTGGLEATYKYIDRALKVASELRPAGVPPDGLATALREPRYEFAGLPQQLMPDHIRNIEAVMRFLKEKDELKAAPPTPAKAPPGKKPGA
jgi:cyclase